MRPGQEALLAQDPAAATEATVHAVRTLREAKARTAVVHLLAGHDDLARLKAEEWRRCDDWLTSWAES